jgi:hypothetical protein
MEVYALLVVILIILAIALCLNAAYEVARHNTRVVMDVWESYRELQREMQLKRDTGTNAKGDSSPVRRRNGNPAFREE